MCSGLKQAEGLRPSGSRWRMRGVAGERRGLVIRGGGRAKEKPREPERESSGTQSRYRQGAEMRCAGRNGVGEIIPLVKVGPRGNQIRNRGWGDLDRIRGGEVQPHTEEDEPER